MRENLVVANWKMNGSQALVASFVSTLSQAQSSFNERLNVVCCPPAILIGGFPSDAGSRGFDIGAQNLNPNGNGAYTGELSATLLVEAGCQFVIVGHSERRSLFGETSQLVAQKAKAALEAGLRPIVCIGETLQEREAGQTEGVLEAQIAPINAELSGLAAVDRVVIAYEPVWAIGTGLSATPEQAQSAHYYIRSKALCSVPSLPILYGGSVKADNAQALFSQPDIDGGLIGGASLQPEEFVKICQSIN